LSTSYHLALALAASGKGGGEDIIVLDKEHLCAGATGIACGVIRNNYFQPAMRELMAHSVDVWETDPEAYSYHPVGYMQISCERMHADIASVSEQQKAIGYESTFEGLAAKAEALGVRIIGGVEVTGFKRDASGAVCRVETSEGDVACDYVVIGAGPWAPKIWKMLELPEQIEIRNPADPTQMVDRPMWTYWSLQEGTLGVDPGSQLTNDGQPPPVLHVDTDAPLFSDVDGSLITDELWGIYYKPDFNFGGVQGGAAPFVVNKPAQEVNVDPYGPESKEFIMGEDFAHMWVSALAHCQKRFSGTMPLYKREPSGGIGAFTPDSFPVFDVFHENCYIVADSNHGYKMLGVGKLVADEICSGRTSTLLEPFRYSRYSEGRLHPVSNSPFPWS
jgi:glycine/D-amino acid oxidase-like deaminating enzyme